MDSIQYHNISEEEGEKCIRFAREALNKYIKEGQRLDVGSADEIFKKKGGVLIQLESENGFKTLRGNGAIYDGRQISDAIIDAIIHASSSRSIGSEVYKSELNDIIIKLSLIESVTLTNEPESILNIDKHGLIVPSNNGVWLYPTKASEHDWTPQEYINRTYRSSRLNPNDFSKVAVVSVKSFREQNPHGKAIKDK